MKKTILIVVVCCFLAGCATWKAMSTSQKIDTVANYYKTFATGLKITAATVAAISPDWASVINSTVIPLIDKITDGADKLMELASSLADPKEIQAQKAEVQKAVEEANAVVGALNPCGLY